MKIDQNGKIMLVIIALFKCLPTFALDTYSPAIPEIASYFGVKQSAVLVTFTSYYIGFSLGILIWGVLSDVYGRKKILQLGAILYLISSILCPLSSTLHELVFARFGQGLGDAACATVAVAILRDCYSGKELLKIMSSLGSLAMIAPIVAPIIGVGLISLTKQWQFIFHFLTFYGLILLASSQLINETLALELRVTKLSRGFYHYITHIKNLTFVLLCLASALVCSAALSFIGASAIIYLKIFHISKWEYVVFFAINGAVIILANFTVKKLADIISHVIITKIAFLCCLFVLLTGYFIVSSSLNSVFIFLIIMSSATYFMSICANTVGVMAIQNISESYGAGISIKNFMAVFCAGIANYTLTKFTDHHLQTYLILQQFTLIVIAALIIYFKLSKTDNI